MILQFFVIYFPVCFYCCDKQHDQKQLGEERVFFLAYSLLSIVQGYGAGIQGRSLEARADAKTMEEHGLACTPGLCSAAMLIPSRTTCPAVSLPTVNWALPHLINQENAPTDLLQANLMGAFSHLRFLFLDVPAKLTVYKE